MNKVLVVFLSLMIVAGCAGRRAPGQSGPIIDTQGVDMSQYRTDLAQCEAYADQVPVGERAATGAVVGAAVGGAVGAILDGGDGAERGAGVGAVSGGVKGTSSGLQERNQVIRNCLRGRGYRVLN